MIRIYVSRTVRLLACSLTLVLLFGNTFFTTGTLQASMPAQESVDASEGQPVVIYFFWGDGCPHCAAAEPFLEELTQRYSNVELRAYEVWYVAENRDLFWRMAAAYDFEPSGVPAIFVGERYWIGYAEPIRAQIESTVAACSLSGCPDAGAFLGVGIPTPAPSATSQSAGASTTAPEAADLLPLEATEQDNEFTTSSTEALPIAATERRDGLELPLIGTVDLAAQSLAASTALIAFVDGFNPCSLWVLSVLLALTLNTSSRKKVFWVGLIFLTVTSLIYMLFITGLFTIFRVIGFLSWIQMVVAVVALFFAAVNIKDYFWYKEGISFTIADEKKPGIYRRMRNVLNAGNSTWGLVVSTIVLAAGVSLVEFSCTAGFPILWTNLLISQQATAATFVLLLLLYMLIYQVDELGIFLVAVFTLKSSRIEEKQGRILKLVGGMLMLALAIVMLVNPALMNSISMSLLVFAVAFAATAVVLLLHRTILPHFGVYVGTEVKPKRIRKRSHRTA